MKRIRIESGIRKFWWLPLITGIISIGLGIWTMVAPAPALEVLAYVFAACMLVAGAFNIVYSVSASKYTPGWGWTLAIGIMELFAGIWLLAMPAAVVVSTFIFVVGFFIIFAAINALCEAFAMSMFSGWWVLWSILLLIATIVLTVIFLTNPVEGGIMTWIWIGLSLLTFGLYRVILAFQIKSVADRV